MRSRWLLAALLCPLVVACATTSASTLRGAIADTDDDADSSSMGAQRPATEAPRRAPTQPLPRPSLGTLPTYRSADIPGGLTCLLRLRELGIAHRVLGPVGFINTPIEVQGPIAGVTYKATWRGRFICDCRLALALSRAGPFFRGVGITTAYYSSAYRRHTRGAKPPSRHALGLAIDLHRFRDEAGTLLRIKADYQRGLEDTCGPGSWPQLNRLGCRLARHKVFDVVLSPDSNADHWNHFHLAIWDFQRRRIPRRHRAHPVIRE